MIGAGVAGLASAWQAARSGLRVVVVERGEPGRGASGVAAGMLAPVTEADFGEEELLRLNLESAALWPAFATELADASGIDVGYHRSGALAVAVDRDDAEELRRVLELQRSLGLESEWLVPSAARAAEPGLAPRIAGAIDAPGEAHVVPQQVVRALVRALEEAGGELICGAEARIRTESGRVTGVDLARARASARGGSASRAGGSASRAGGSASAPSKPASTPAAPAATATAASGCAPPQAGIRAEHVVLAAGAWSGELAGVPVRPVKGQLLHLRPRAGAQPPLERIVRTPRCYIVPRADGHVVVGATSEERGFDTAVDAGAVHRLLEAAWEVLPDVWELEFAEALAGLRPGTPDNRPLVGPGPLNGLILATGHHRNGVLLAPVTAERVTAALTGQRVSV